MSLPDPAEHPSRARSHTAPQQSVFFFSWVGVLTGLLLEGRGFWMRHGWIAGRSTGRCAHPPLDASRLTPHARRFVWLLVWRATGFCSTQTPRHTSGLLQDAPSQPVTWERESETDRQMERAGGVQPTQSAHLNAPSHLSVRRPYPGPCVYLPNHLPNAEDKVALPFHYLYQVSKVVMETCPSTPFLNFPFRPSPSSQRWTGQIPLLFNSCNPASLCALSLWSGGSSNTAARRRHEPDFGSATQCTAHKPGRFLDLVLETEHSV